MPGSKKASKKKAPKKRSVLQKMSDYGDRMSRSKAKKPGAYQTHKGGLVLNSKTNIVSDVTSTMAKAIDKVQMAKAKRSSTKKKAAAKRKTSTKKRSKK